MKREELVEYSVVCIDDIPSDVRDEAINGCTSFFAFDSMDAEEVMGAYKQRIKDLEAENERLKAHVPVWHVVADGDLPKIGETVLTSNTHGAMNYAEFVGTRNEKTMWLYHDVQYLDEIMYWCAIPKPSSTKENPNEA